jgi:hypothetical protein
MKYLCLICADPQYMMEYRTEADAARHYDEYLDFTREIRKSGHFVAANRLLPPAEAVTVRVRDGKTTTTDGPFAETKEHLGGYYIVEAQNLDEAVRIAARIPGARYGCVEVRPVAGDAMTLRAIGE